MSRTAGHRRVVAALTPLGLAILLTLTGCSIFAPLPLPTTSHDSTKPTSQPTTPAPSPSEDDAGNVNQSAAYQEYVKATKKFKDELPDGYEFPDEYPQGNPDMAPKGSGTGAALYYWRCAWTDKFLADFDSKNDALIEYDLDTLDTWKDFAWVRENDVLDGYSWTDDVIEPARDGEISLLRTLGYSGCKEVVKVDRTPTPPPSV